jgi:hypothetical protein
VDYNGHTDAGVIAGLTASIDFSNFTFTHQSSMNRTRVRFDMGITNTSSGPITGSRISVLGFNTAESIQLSSSSVSGVFNRVRDGNMSSAGSVDFCFSGVNCSGGGGGGVTLGNTGTATATLYFTGNHSSLTFDDMFVRYQSIAGAVDSRGRAITSAVGTGSSAAPEPVSLVTLAVGCVGIWQIRKRRQAQKQSI